MPANFPSSPTLNQTYSYNGSTWSWTGSYWRLETSQAMTGIAFTYGNAAPSSPNVGDRWIDTTTMLELVYVYDGNSYQWVELSSQAPSTNLAAVSTSITPTANVAYDLGSNTNRWRDLYLSGNSLIIGGATITANGSAIALPSGTTVGGQSVASGGDVATGGGPKITNLQITDNSWTVLDDTAVDTAGGYVLITGTNFVSGALVYLNQTPATSVAFVSATTLRVTVPALTASTYVVYVINPDGGTAIRVPGLTASANPAWQTASTLPEQYDGVAITLNLVATEATSYSITSGSLPPGLTLNTSTGAITGTVTGVSVDTVYTFTVRATDAQLQESPRTFTVTITVSDPYFKLTTLLLSGSAISANTVVRDSSTNNFNLTVSGDARASNFSPYGTGWSVYFDGTGDYLNTPAGSVPSSLAQWYNTNYTIEMWVYPMAFTQGSNGGSTAYGEIVGGGGEWWSFGPIAAGTVRLYYYNGSIVTLTTTSTISLNTWTHLAFVNNSSTLTIYINGILSATGTIQGTPSDGTNQTNAYVAIGRGAGEVHFNGYISNLRAVRGTAVYTANFTPATTTLTAVANTSLLTCHANRFLDGSTNNFAITRNGDAKVVSFNPFNITNTGVNGSMYFDGTDDRLVGPTSTILDLDGAINFTIEAWVYPTSYGSTADMSLHIVRKFTGAGGVGYAYGIQGGGANQGKISLYGAGGSISLTSTNQVPINTWSHICVVKNSTTFTHYLNGQPNGSVTTATTLTASTDNLLIADYGYAEKFKGYMSELRIVKGTALYTTTFTPPTSPLTAIANTQLLTLQYDQPHNNHTFLDSSSNQFVITRSGNATQGTFSPFSPAGYSYYLDGGDQFSSPSTANLNLNLYNNWTVEGWFYRQGPFGVNDNALSLGTKRSAVWWSFYVGTAGGGVAVGFGTGAWAFVTAPTGPSSGINLNQWHHVAFVRNGASTMLIFIDGILQYTNTSYNFGSATQGGTLYIGSYVNDADNVGAYYNGYISNLRIVNGQSLYTANFTPSTSSLTTTSQGAIASNVAILTAQTNRFIDVSLSARALTMSGDARVVAFSPFAPTAVYNPVVHGGSAYFDGTGDYLEMTYNPAFKFAASQDFCVEFWAYATSSLTANYILSQVTTNNWGFIFGVGAVTSGRISVYYGNGATNSVQYLDDTAAFPLYQWIHVAWCRTSGTMSLFVDGTRRSTVSNTNAINLTTDRGIRIGAHQDGAANQFWPGYIASLRSIVGNSPYNATLTTLTLPTTPVTSTANTSILLNFTDAAILDSTGRTVLETVADARSTSVVTKFTGGSMYFDGTGDGLAWPISSTPFYQIVSTNWTIEMWMYKFSTAIKNIMRCGPANAGNINRGWSIGIDPSINTIYFSSSGADNTFTGATIAINTWVHLAFSYTVSDSTLRVFYNGTSAGTKANPALVNPTIAGGDFLTVATPYSGTAHFDGYLSDIRFTQGYARYTANFTAPTAPARLK